MAGRPKDKNNYPTEDIVTALKETRGLITLAADKLGCNPLTVRNRIAKSKELQELVASFREKRVDTAELALDKAIMNGEAWAIALVLKTLGKNRGYVERTETEQSGEVTIKVVYADPGTGTTEAT